MTEKTYQIVVRVIQNNPAKWFSIVEKTVWHSMNEGDGSKAECDANRKSGNIGGGTWAECDGEQTLSVPVDTYLSSGKLSNNSSGTLRFKNADNEYFLVALGVHQKTQGNDNIRWCDIMILNEHTTAHENHRDYYNSKERKEVPKSHLQKKSKELNDATITVKYYDESDNKSYATITIEYKLGR